MPPTRSPHDPFTASSNAASSLRPQPSQTGLRSHASSASTRPRQPPNLFAPSLLRRPTSRTTPRVEEDVVLPDSESDQDVSLLGQAQRPRPQHLRRARHGSPEYVRHARLRPRQEAEDQDIVNRQPDGSYLLGAATLGIVAPQAIFALGPQDGDMTPDQLDSYQRDLARRYFTSGIHMDRGHSKAAEVEFEQERPELIAALREQVMQKLEDEKWLYEPVERFHTGFAWT